MFVSHKFRLVFLEVPRTGSHAISDALDRIDPGAPTAVARRSGDPYFAYHDMRIPEDALHYTVFACHRNPYDRLWSFWKYRRATGNPAVFKGVSWHEYVRWVSDPSSVPRITDAMHDIPICEMLDIVRVDHWLRFDRLNPDWRSLCEHLDLPRVDLDILNVSRNQGDYQSAYDQWLADKVFERFQSDFSSFGYDHRSWRGEDTLVSAGKQVTEPEPTRGCKAPRARVAILTDFKGSDPAYSLGHVVQDQIAMLVKHGYSPKVLVAEAESWNNVSENYVLPGVELVMLPNIRGLAPDAMEKVPALAEALSRALDGIDVVLTHDIVYLPSSRAVCAAALRVACENPRVRWLHWIHSVTSILDLFADKGLQPGVEHRLDSWPNASAVCFNHMSIGRIAESFHCHESNVRVVPHPIDVCRYFGMSSLAVEIYESLELYAVDLISTLPTRLDRAKQVEWPVKIMSRLKASGETIRLIVMDFHSRDKERSEYRSELKFIARQWGLVEGELVFLSEYCEATKAHAPRSLVRELLQLSSVMVFASRAESYSLAAQEAAVTGNLLVLNEDFVPMREIYGENALYFKFSANIDRSNFRAGFTRSDYQDVELDSRPASFPDSQIYQQDGKWFLKGDAVYADYVAACIRDELNRNKVLAQRRDRLRHRNIFSVFKQHLEPLIQTAL